MDSSPSSVLTEGFGVWGSVNLMTTLGYGIFAVASAIHTATGTWEVPSRTGTWEVPSHTGSWEVPE